jgi:hypothetical protein
VHIIDGCRIQCEGPRQDTLGSDLKAVPTHACEVSLNELLTLLIRDRRVVLKEAVVPHALGIRTCAASA